MPALSTPQHIERIETTQPSPLHLCFCFTSNGPARYSFQIYHCWTTALFSGQKTCGSHLAAFMSGQLKTGSCAPARIPHSTASYDACYQCKCYRAPAPCVLRMVAEAWGGQTHCSCPKQCATPSQLASNAAGTTRT